jgi:penicillin V acylase-like amidase (Ntn superfamily)
LITPQFRANYATYRNRADDLDKRLKEMTSFTYLTNEQPSPFQRERLGVPVTRLCCYRMVSDNDTRFYTFELTEENKVAWYQSSAD